jgi:D-alanine-D-alanine ligase
VVETLDDVERVDLPLPLFVKPVAEGTGKGVTPRSVIRRREELLPACRDLLERYRQPVLVETLLPGRELTTGILGTGDLAEVVGTIEVILLPAAEQEVYSYVNKERCEELVEYRLVSAADDPVVAEAERVALAAWRALGCRDGGRVDLRCDDAGRPQFLEVNPLAGLHPEHSDLPIIATKVGLPYGELLRRIVASAAARVHRVQPALAATG